MTTFSKRYIVNRKVGLTGLLILAVSLVILIFGPNPLAINDYQRITQAGGTLQSEDGARINFPTEMVGRSFRAKLITIRRLAVFGEETSSDIREAVDNIPANLIIKSSLYQVAYRGSQPTGMQVRLPLPNDTELFKTLDLYIWNGETWDWRPSHKNLTLHRLEASLVDAPELLVIMQANEQATARLSVDYRPTQSASASLAEADIEINPQGLQLGGDGRIVGTVVDLSFLTDRPNVRVMPVLQNSSHGAAIRSDLVNNMLINPAARSQHIGAIVGLVEEKNFDGVDLDYQGVNPDLKQTYTDFLAELRRALPAKKQLSVRLVLPQQVSEDIWDTGAYDWSAIGQIVERIKILPASDPRDYVLGGQIETALDWAVGQVNRIKLQPLLQVNSTEATDGLSQEISHQEALSRIKMVTVDRATRFMPGDPIDFALVGMQTTNRVQFDRDSGIYWFRHPDETGQLYTIYLAGIASLSRKMQFLAQYNLGGIGLQNRLGVNYDDRVWGLLQNFPNPAILPGGNQYVVLWQVRDEAGQAIDEVVVPLSDADYRWSTTGRDGVYQVTTMISDNPTLPVDTPQGRLSVIIAQPTPQPTPTPSPTATASPSPTATFTPTPTSTPTPFPSPTTASAPQATAVPGGCVTLPQGDFAALWQAQPDRFGCALESDPLYGTIVEMPFEHGHLFWIRDIDKYGPVALIFSVVGGQNEGDSGTWSLHNDTWQGEGICSVGPPPEGLFLPDRNLAKVWCEIQGLDLLGYSMIPQEFTPERGVAALQNFENVIVLRDSLGQANNLVYLLLRADNTYRRVRY